MANPYPANVLDANGETRVAGQVNFTDPANQPGAASPFPTEWTATADDFHLRWKTTAEGIFKLQRGEDANTGTTLEVGDTGAGTDAQLKGVARGDGHATLQLYNQDDADGAGTFVDGQGLVQLFTDTGHRAIEAWDAAGNTLRFAVLPAGQMMTGVLAAPADGDLAAGQLAFWFDDTNGASKLMLKGKSANGTVVTGAVALT